MRIVIVIASRGRPGDLQLWLDHVARQSMIPIGMIWSVTSDGDLPEGDWRSKHNAPVVCCSAPGLTRQRNAALLVLPENIDIVAFFDDDYVPSSRCLQGIADFFSQYPEAVGVTGKILADGIKTSGIGVDEAMCIVTAHDKHVSAARPTLVTHVGAGLYGCNMAYRMQRLMGETFDENLPLYGWQEDVDFANRVAKYGTIGVTDAFAGVHRGAKEGRGSGRKLGYSQVANPIYLWKKKTISASFAIRLMIRNVLANHARFITPEPWVDRRGRAAGNWMAIGDLLRGGLDPMKVLVL